MRCSCLSVSASPTGAHKVSEHADGRRRFQLVAPWEQSPLPSPFGKRLQSKMTALRRGPCPKHGRPILKPVVLLYKR
eukprot:1157086-Pelagomonas_calceolata.AAC.4